MAGLSIEKYARSVRIFEAFDFYVKFSEKGNNSAKLHYMIFEIAPLINSLLTIPYQLNEFQSSSLNTL